MSHVLFFFVAFLLSLILSFFAVKLLPKLGFTDRIESHSLKKKLVPRGGGVAIFLTFTILALIFLPLDRKLVGLIVGGGIVFLVNFIDDRVGLKWYMRLGAELLAALVIIAFGIGMLNISNPLSGEAIALDFWRIPIGSHYIVPISDLFTIIWILVFVNMLNWLDGLDGLAAGVSGICALTLFALATLPFVDQPEMAKLALILAGAVTAFLIFNFYPAKIRLGDSGSTFLGFTLAVLAIYASGKIATFFLVLGLPLLDVAWVIGRRVFLDKKTPFHGDQKHFHHRLLKAGFSERKVVIIYYLFCASFGTIALVLQGAQQKLLAIAGLLTATVTFAAWVVWRGKEKRLDK